MIDSPLFAVEAQELLDEGKVQEAIDLCNEGLKIFPNYQAAVGILAQAYKQIGDEEKANETLNEAIEKFPTSKSLGNLKKFDLELPKFIETDIEDIKEMNSEDILADLSKYEEHDSNIEEVEEGLDDVGFGEYDFGDEVVDEAIEEEIVEIEDEDSLGEEIESNVEFNIELNDEFEDDSETDLADKFEDIDGEEDVLVDIEDENVDIIDVLGDENEFGDDEIEETIIDESLEILDSKEVGNEKDEDLESDVDEVVELDMLDKDLFGEWNINELMPRFSYEFNLDTLPDLEFIERFKGVELELPIYFGDDSASNTLELDTLAKNLEGAKIGPAGSKPNVAEGDFSEVNQPQIATETLAKIYEEQDAFGEAIRIYELLAEQEPERNEYFESKIEKLKNHIL